MLGRSIESSESSTKRTRIITGCESCRVLHLRCDNSPSCARCQQSGIECVRPTNIRFRHQPKSISDTELLYSPNQTWIKLPKEIRYFDETPRLIRLHEDEDDEFPSFSPEEDEVLDSGIPRRDEVPESSDFSLNEPQSAEQISTPSMNALSPLGNTLPADPTRNMNVSVDSSDGAIRVQNDEAMTVTEYMDHSQEPNPELEHVLYQSTSNIRQDYVPHPLVSNESPVSVDVLRDLGTFYTGGSPFTPREAVLMRNFIENMALWADVTDLERHFEVVVPRRALHQPVLRYAIFAFSSRHLSRFYSYDEIEAIQFHDKCLELLIPVLSGPSENINEDILAAVAILRQYEEMDAYDQQFHLTGTTRILNSVAKFGCSGGLGEAAGWLCLRGDIYISLVTQQPLKTHLGNYTNSATFHLSNDVSWANKMVFLLAKVLSCAFHPEPDTDMAALQQVSEEIEDWARIKPTSFEPILFEPRSPEKGRAFPQIWMLLPFHVVGLQYYHLAKIVLAISTPRTALSSYESLREGRKLEKTVRNHLLVILGLATSNKKAENILFTARHALSVWGGVLREKLERDAAVDFLRKMEETTGWRTSQLIRSLEEQWEEDSDKS